MKFLDTENVCVKKRRSKLLLDLYDLLGMAESGLVNFSKWADVRGHANMDAIRQDLDRTRKLLRSFRVKFDFWTDDEGAHVDLRSDTLRAFIALEIDRATEFLAIRQGEDLALSHEDANLSSSCLKCGEPLRIPLEELVSLRSSSIFMSTSELRKRLHVGHPRLKRILKSKNLERKPGRQPVETIRPKDDVARAATIARSKSAFKLRVREIAELLECSARTASRFIQRVRGGRVSSTDRRRS